jgi:single-stranded-DNA-specific exonuclease
MGEHIEELVSAERKICVAFTPKVNEWKGNRSIELEINDFQAGAVAKLS